MRTSARETQVSAHRGGSEQAAPETLEAYRVAAEAGVDYAEVDVRWLGDGTLVAWHDPTTRGGEPLFRLTLAEFRLKAGYQVPRVSEVLDAVAGRCRCHIDLKEAGYEDDVIDLALRMLGADGFVVTSTEEDSIRVVKQRFPQVRAGLCVGRDLRGLRPPARVVARLGELFPAARVKASGADFVCVEYRLAVLRVLRCCGRRGLPAFVWTVNAERRIRRLLRDPRVQCVITDRPLHALTLRSRETGVLSSGPHH